MVNKVRLDDEADHTYNSTVVGTVTSTSISGTQFNLAAATPGSYYIKVSKDGGTTWFSSSSPLLTITADGTDGLPVHKGSIDGSSSDAHIGYPNDLQVIGNYAYIPSAYALEIVDVSNPANPTHKGKLRMGENGAILSDPYGIFISGDYAYITNFAGSYGGDVLESVDISNPENPTHKGSIADGVGNAVLESPRGVYVSGGFAYVVSWGGDALEIVDISNPENPTHKGSIRDGTNGALLEGPETVFVSGMYAYIASGGSSALEIVDISIPANPQHKGSTIVSEGNADSPTDVFVSGNYAYLTVDKYEGEDALVIVDISNPALPVIRGSISAGSSGALLNSPSSVHVVGNTAYITSRNDNALELVDVSDPTHPVHKGKVVNGDNGAILDSPECVYVSGSHVFVANQNSLEILEIESGSTPPTISSITPSTGSNTVSITLTGANFATDSNTVQLTRTGQTAITATNVNRVSSSQITCTLPITGKAVGVWNVVLTTGGQTVTKDLGFTITASNPPRYEAVYSADITWDQAKAAAAAKGGHLVTISSADENQLVYNLCVNDDRLWFDRWGIDNGPWIGGYQKPGSSEPDGGWTWVTGEAWSYSYWRPPSYLDNYGGNEDKAHFVGRNDEHAGSWNDAGVGSGWTTMNGYVIEYEPLTITSITPSTAPNTGNQQISVSGTEFRNGAVVNLTNASYSISGTINSITSNTIKCTFPLTGAPTRSYNLSVRNVDGSVETKVNAFTVTNTSPTIGKVSPIISYNTADTNLTITGTNFRNGITATLISDIITLPGINLTKTGTTQVQYTFQTTNIFAGKYNLTLTNIDGSTVTQTSAFELKSPSDQPAIITTFPYSGPNNAAKDITITGSNFRGPTSTTFTGISVTLTNEILGTTITGTPTSKKAQKTNTLYYTLPLTGKPAGIYNLTVRNYDGSSCTNTSGFIITTTNPTVSKISPASGYTTKDQSVTLTGTNFRTGAGVTLTNGSTPYNGNGVTLVSPISLTCSLPLLTDHITPGKYNVTVTNTDGTSGTLVNKFTVIAPANSPVISTIIPAFGLNNVAKPVTISGSNFSKQTVTITNGTFSRTVTATTGKTQKSTTLYYTLPLTGLVPGSYLVKVTNSDGTSGTISFSIDPTIPTIKTISPAQGYSNGDTSVILTGTNYRPGVTVNLTNLSANFQATTKTVTSTQITCMVPTTKMMGIYNVTVSNDDPTNEYNTNVTKKSGFTVSNPGTNPTITRITPTGSPNSASKAVTITGTNFRGPASSSFTGIKVTITNETLGTTVTGTPTPKKAHLSTTLYYTLPLTGVPAGLYTLIVTNYDGSSVTKPDFFTVTTTYPAIAIDSTTKKEKITPITAFNTSPVNITILGTNFRDGVQVNLTNPSTPVVKGTVITRTNTQILSQFPLSGKPAGKYTLMICNTDGTNVTAKTLFEVKKPGSDPVISSITPASAFNTGNLAVTITGKYFNKPTVYINQGELTKKATATAKKTSTTTVLYVTLPLSGVPGGLYDLMVRNADGVNTTAEGFFWVTDKASVSSIQTSPVVGNNVRMPVMQVPQIIRPAGSGTSTGSLVVVPRGPVVVKG